MHVQHSLCLIDTKRTSIKSAIFHIVRRSDVCTSRGNVAINSDLISEFPKQYSG